MKWWNIDVTEYGDFQYFGTRAQADERASAKAQWEGGHATVREATTQEAEEGRAHIKWRKENGYPLERWERDALSLS